MTDPGTDRLFVDKFVLIKEDGKVARGWYKRQVVDCSRSERPSRTATLGCLHLYSIHEAANCLYYFGGACCVLFYTYVAR